MLPEPIVENAALSELKKPVLIMAFSSSVKGGATATAALNYAVQRWQAEPVTSLEADGYYNYSRMRPWVRRVDGTTVVDWPENTLYRIDGPEHSYLILVGVEPTLRWREFVNEVSELAMSMGVETAVSLKSMPAPVPHTQEAPVRAIYSSPELAQEYGIPELEDQDGPADIGRILNLQLASLGCRTVDIFAMEPYYTSAITDAGASLSLLKALRSEFDLAVDTEPLLQLARNQRSAIDAAVASSEQMRDTIAVLEQRVAGPIFANQPLLQAPPESASELDVESVLDEVEDMFRGFGSDT